MGDKALGREAWSAHLPKIAEGGAASFVTGQALRIQRWASPQQSAISLCPCRIGKAMVSAAASVLVKPDKAKGKDGPPLMPRFSWETWKFDRPGHPPAGDEI